ncbi:XrtA system polysaccharide chain length determinant [Marinobacter orientalis]|uniref:Lipopolysaccharide biosynthesis protein n=1 Tax=Marinobacter orientalis TaxID=1928859 RepID=A0A7Y0RCP5_9GAMM|nr:XrtA system polysaccharide chain length determinant [Marinobacter orientalis]NMT63808.1 lipopolysaccharide biosynthesis protein [Marinobacter orientalis]TGX49914.1 lipopolysaccharide biosynthesis protein [Marinobacter orientalis]
MALPLSQIPSEMFREVRSHKWLVLVLFAVVSFAVLTAGFFWPYKYESQVVIFVDDQNIIRPLMEGSAVTTEISERTSVAREMLWSRDVMSQVARDTEIFGPDADQTDGEALERRVEMLRANMNVRPRGDSYFSIGYSSESSMQAFRVAQRLGQLFISENSERKRKESRNAYGFIDKQVKNYESILADVEQKLKRFLSENVDGTESEANARMANLRRELELAEMERTELMARAASLDSDLQNVQPMFSQGRTADAYTRRIREKETMLDELRLRYHDTYPDIVVLKEQIAELRRQRDRAAQRGELDQATSGGEQLVNPLYQDISAEVAKTRADIRTQESRINSLQNLIAEQEMRMERIQENKAQYSELTRDMEVNEQIYNDLLKRREKARVSMHLDIEGQGLNFRMAETAQYPLGPEGPQFELFASAGLILGALFPFGLVAGMLQIDPRVRARKQLEDGIGLPVLAEIPHVRTPYEKRKDRFFTVSVSVCAVLVVAAYGGVAGAALMGVI